MQGVDKHSLLS